MRKLKTSMLFLRRTQNFCWATYAHLVNLWKFKNDAWFSNGIAYFSQSHVFHTLWRENFIPIFYLESQTDPHPTFWSSHYRQYELIHRSTRQKAVKWSRSLGGRRIWKFQKLFSTSQNRSGCIISMWARVQAPPKTHVLDRFFFCRPDS